MSSLALNSMCTDIVLTLITHPGLYTLGTHAWMNDCTMFCSYCNLITKFKVSSINITCRKWLIETSLRLYWMCMLRMLNFQKTNLQPLRAMARQMASCSIRQQLAKTPLSNPLRAKSTHLVRMHKALSGLQSLGGKPLGCSELSRLSQRQHHMDLY